MATPVAATQRSALLSVLAYFQQAPFDDVLPVSALPWAPEFAADLGRPGTFLRNYPYLFTLLPGPAGEPANISRASSMCVPVMASVTHHACLFLAECGGEATLAELENLLLWSMTGSWAEPLLGLLRRSPKWFEVHRRDGTTIIRLRSDRQVGAEATPVLTGENIVSPPNASPGSGTTDDSPTDPVAAPGRLPVPTLGEMVQRLVTAIGSIQMEKVPVKFLAKYMRWRRSHYGDIQRFVHSFPVFFRLHGEGADEVSLVSPLLSVDTTQVSDPFYDSDDTAISLVRKVVSNFPLDNQLAAGSIDWSSHAAKFGRLQTFLAQYPEIFDLTEFPLLKLRVGAEDLLRRNCISGERDSSSKRRGLRASGLPPKKQLLVAPREVIEQELDVISIPVGATHRVGDAAVQFARQNAPTAQDLLRREAFRTRLENLLNDKLQELRVLNDDVDHLKYQCRLYVFGSTVTGLVRKSSDVDLAVLPVEIQHFRDNWLGTGSEISRLQILQRLLRWLGCHADVLSTARVPVISVRQTNCSDFEEFDFDLTLRPFGVLNSLLIRTYFDTAPVIYASAVFLCNLAKREGIVNSPAGLLSTYSLTLLLVYFFHVTRNLPIISPSSVKLTEPALLVPSLVSTQIESTYVGDVIIDFLQFFTHQFNPEIDIVSIDLRSHSELIELKQQSFLCIADPFEQYFNVARNIDAGRWKYIQVALHRILRSLC